MHIHACILSILLVYYFSVLRARSSIIITLDSRSMHTTRVGVVQRSSRKYERVLLMYAYYYRSSRSRSMMRIILITS